MMAEKKTSEKKREVSKQGLKSNDQVSISKKYKSIRLFQSGTPALSEEEKMEMDFTLFDCYSQNKVVYISYYQNGTICSYSGVIENIDVLNKQIILLPKRKFFIPNIISVIAK